MKRIVAVLLTFCLLASGLCVGASASSTAKAYDFRFSGYIEEGDVSATCYYTDDYFLQDSREYSAHLATMSLCLELSTWPRLYEEGMEWTTQVSDTSNAAWQNVWELLTDLGFSDITPSDSWNDWPTPQGVGVVAAKKTLTGGEHLVVLSVRGGGYEEEWASNFTVGADGEHEGFASAAMQALDFLKTYLADNGIDGNIKLWLVGYSRGGAVANMAAGKLNNGYDLGAASLAPQDLFAYTFEAPMGATVETAAVGTHDNLHNIVNPNDAITRVAPSAWQFARYGDDRELPSAASLGDEAFAEQLEVMVSHYNTFKGADEDSYTLSEYATPHTVKINWAKLLSGVTDGAVTVTEGDSVATAVLLEESLTVIADQTIGGREAYAAELQSDIVELTAMLMSGKPSYNIKNVLPVDAIMALLSERLTADAIMEIISPFTEFSKPIEVRKQQMRDNLYQFLLSLLTDAGVENPEWYAERLTNVLFVPFFNVATALMTGDVSSLEALLDLMSMVVDGGVAQAHYPEVTLAWMMAQDSFYNGEAPVPPSDDDVPVDPVPADGDVSGDGTVNITDAVQLYYHVNGKITLDEAALARGDVASPEGVTIADAVMIYYLVNGKA